MQLGATSIKTLKHLRFTRTTLSCGGRIWSPEMSHPPTSDDSQLISRCSALCLLIEQLRSDTWHLNNRLGPRISSRNGAVMNETVSSCWAAFLSNPAVSCVSLFVSRTLCVFLLRTQLLLGASFSKPRLLCRCLRGHGVGAGPSSRQRLYGDRE